VCKGQPHLQGSDTQLPTLKVHKLRHNSEICTEQSGLQTFNFGHTYILISYTTHLHVANEYLSVADYARDAVLLHVSASSERQKYENGTDTIKKTTEPNLLTQRRLRLQFLIVF